MIYYYRQINQSHDVPMIRITISSLELVLKVAEWFPANQQKLKKLLDMMNEYDDDGMLPDILIRLIEDLKDEKIFLHRTNRKKDMFRKMLHKNIDNIIEYGGKL